MAAADASAPRSLVLMLDIDNTLYENSETHFGEEMRDRIFLFAETKLGIPREVAVDISRRYLSSYGLSLRGYVENYHVDAKEYSDFVHQCSYETLTYQKPLVEMLQRLHYGRVQPPPAGTEKNGALAYAQQPVLHHLYYFTNANKPHARKVLEPIGLAPLFTRPRQASSPAIPFHKAYDAEGFDDAVEWLGFSYEDQWRLTGPSAMANKPMRAAYEAVFHAIEEEVSRDEQQLKAAAPSALSEAFIQHKRGVLQPCNMVMVDDSLMNLDAPLALGWSAVWYAHGQKLPDPSEAGDHAAKAKMYEEAVKAGRLKVIHNILELEEAVRELSTAA